MKKTFKNLLFIFLFLALAASFAFAAIKEAKERNQIPDKYKWDLTSMYKTNSDWETDFAACEKLLHEMEKYKGKPAKSAKTLLLALQLADKISILNDKTYHYMDMRFSEDSNNTFYQSLLSRAENLNAKVKSSLALLKTEIIDMPQNDINLFFEKEKDLNVYKFYFERLRRLKSHALSAKEEEILISMRSLSMSIRYIYDTLKDAGVKFPKVPDENGKEIQLSNSVFDSALKSTDRSTRKRFYEAFYKTYGGYAGVFASILSAKLRADWLYAKNRKYNSALECSTDERNGSANIYDNLIFSVNANLKPLHRYYALRKKISGLKDYAVYDNYYPVVKAAGSEITYEKAQEIIKKALGSLGKDYLKIVNDIFEKQWVDVYENKGKISGGYNWTFYDRNPHVFIFLNFDNTLSSTSILAHEVGHCVYFYLSASNQPYVNTSIEPSFIEEMPAIFNEHLLANYLLENCKDKKEKLYLILEYLKNVIVRRLYERTMYAEFEREIRTRVEQDKSLTKKDLNKLYYDLCKKYYGPDVIVDEVNAYEWAKLQYLMMNYYAYQYATNLIASTFLFEKVKQEGKPALDRYMTLLKSGYSDYPINLLKKAGVDMSKPESILPAVRLFEKLLDEAEKLVNEGVK